MAASKSVGARLPKNPNSESVINIVPPRALWDSFESIRKRYIREPRCGPHISFVDPFVTPESYAAAEPLLREALADFPPFRITLQKFGHFIHKSSVTLFLEPDVEPPNAIDALLERITAVFPQCDDMIVRGEGKFKAHFTIANFKSPAKMKEKRKDIEAEFVPMSWVVRDVFVLSRRGGDPFSVAMTIPLGGPAPAGLEVPACPYFGPESAAAVVGARREPVDEAVARSLFVANFRRGTTNDGLLAMFDGAKARPVSAEVARNPNGAPRQCGVVEFATEDEAREVVASFRAPDAGVYFVPLAHTVYPSVVGGCTSVDENGVSERD